MMSYSRPVSVPALAAALAGLTLVTAAAPALGAAGPRTARLVPLAVARIALAASRTRLLVGDTATLQATAYDAQGNPLTAARLSFRASSGAVRVAASGVVVGVRVGSANVCAVAGKVKSNLLAFDVTRVARVTVSPATAPPLHEGETALFQATALDPKGAALPNVRITWRSSNTQVATISNSGALRAASAGTTQLVAAAGKVKSLPVTVTVQPRAASSATRVFLRDAPSDEVTVLTEAQIDALVGQPIDVLKLRNLKQLLGTTVLPNGDYQAVRVTLSTADGANYVTDGDGGPIDLSLWDEDAAFELPLEFTVADGHPTNLVLDFPIDESIWWDEDGDLALVPSYHGGAQDDAAAESPIGSIVGQVMPAAAGAVLAVRTGTEEDDPEFGVGIINGETGAFRIGGLAAGTYELHVRIEGSDDVIVGDIVVLAGEDTVLPEPIVLEGSGPEELQEPQAPQEQY
jgi:Domain of unknown function (DUF4382)/Bacterial Ig-like domain (group 2)